MVHSIFRRLAWLCIILWLVACAPRQAPVSPALPQPPPVMLETPPAPAPLATGSELVASIVKSPCFGACPAFEVWIYSDGTVLWCGEAGVERLGSYLATAPTGWLSQWETAAESAGFWDLLDWYPVSRNLLPDVPTTVSYLKKGKKERRIVNNADAPLALLRLEKFWIKKLEELDWKPL